jgi:molybdopterin converting factor small subunit
MTITVHFWSYFRDLTGIKSDQFEVPPGTRVGAFLDVVYGRHATLVPLRGSALVAVGVEYADSNQVLEPGSEVSLFPPVQGG